MIRLFHFLFKFYIDASIHVALVVYALFYLFVQANQLVYKEAIAYTLFYGTITGYNFVKFAPIAKLYHRSLTKNLRLIQLFSLLCFLALLYYAYQLPIRTVAVFLIGMLVVFAYVVPFLRNKNLRSIGGLKIYIVAFCWVLSIIIAPTIHYKLPLSNEFYLRIIQVFILVVALIIPFDIRDLKYDEDILQTIPQKIGVQKAKILACSLLLIYLGIDFFLRNYFHSIASLLMVSIGLFMILKMQKKQGEYYCSFGIESLPILKLVILLIIICF